MAGTTQRVEIKLMNVAKVTQNVLFHLAEGNVPIKVRQRIADNLVGSHNLYGGPVVTQVRLTAKAWLIVFRWGGVERVAAYSHGDGRCLFNMSLGVIE